MKEAKFVKTWISHEAHGENANLSPAEKEIAEIKKTSERVLADIKQVKEVQKQLKDEGQELSLSEIGKPEKEDEELVEIQKNLSQALKEAQGNLDAYK